MSTTRIVLDSPCKTEGPRFEQREDGRFCLHCREMQYDLRDATRAEVIALATSKGGRICGQLRLGPGGEPKFKPEPPPRGLAVLRGAAVALALAACDTPSEATVTPEPTTAVPPPTQAETPPPSTTVAAPMPPSSVVIAPPTTTTTSADGIDHSTDSSPHIADHQHHAHTHPPATIDPGELTGVGDIGTSYGGGVSVSQIHGGLGGPTGVGSGSIGRGPT